MWPDGIQSTAALSFDLDAETAWTGDLREWAPLGTYGAKVGTPLILSILEKHGILATFFIPGQAAETHPEIVASIITAGHEVGAHGYTHNPRASLSIEEEEDELIKVCEILEGFGAKVEGFRAPAGPLSDNTINLLAKHEYAYETSMYDEIMPYKHAGTDLIELPVSPVFDDWASYGGDDMYSRFSPPNSMVQELWEAEFEGIYELGGPVITVMHPYLTGRPARLKLLDNFIGFIKSHSDVQLSTCAQIAGYVRESLQDSSTH
jgi:peptidoglycan/xylan/chitin deacetylase (PgdA/CDA1 family)